MTKEYAKFVMEKAKEMGGPLEIKDSKFREKIVIAWALLTSMKLKEIYGRK